MEKNEVKILTEKDLETTINQTLSKANVTDIIIAGLKEKYGSLRLKSVDDTESYLELKEARKEVRGIAIIAEKICKIGREDSVRIQKLWLAKEKEIVQVKIGEIQAPIDKGMQEYEENKAKVEAEEVRLREEAFMQRQATLLKMGATYEGGNFNLAEISYEVSNVKGADDEIWSDIILPKFKKVFDRVEAVKVEEETKRAAETEKLRIEKEQFEKDREEFRKQQETLQIAQDENAKIQRDRLMEEQQAVAAKWQLQWDTRAKQLRGLGLMYNGAHDAFVLEDINVDNKTELSLLENGAWDALVERITPVVDGKMKEIELRLEQSREEQKAKDIEEGKKLERERIEEEKVMADFLKTQQDEERKEQMEQQSDKQKWEVFLGFLDTVQIPELKSRYHKRKAAIAKEKIQEIIEL